MNTVTFSFDPEKTCITCGTNQDIHYNLRIYPADTSENKILPESVWCSECITDDPFGEVTPLL
jgi:hypothetical protein